MLAGSASVGLSFVSARRFISGLAIAPAALTTYQMVLALVTLRVVTDLDGVTAIAGDLRAFVALVIGLGLLGTGVAYILYYFIVDRLGAITASSASYIPLSSRSPSAGSWSASRSPCSTQLRSCSSSWE